MGTTRILREADVFVRTGLSRSTRWRLEKLGGFPKRVRLKGRAVGWRSDDIESWIANRPLVEAEGTPSPRT